MPETPDFKAEARRIVHRFELRTDQRLHDTLREVESDLRNLWNARPALRCDQCRYLGEWIPAQRAFECQVIRHTSDESPRPHTARLQVDCEVGGYGGRLLIQPDFGCVQWEAKR